MKTINPRSPLYLAFAPRWQLQWVDDDTHWLYSPPTFFLLRHIQATHTPRQRPAATSSPGVPHSWGGRSHQHNMPDSDPRKTVQSCAWYDATPENPRRRRSALTHTMSPRKTRDGAARYVATPESLGWHRSVPIRTGRSTSTWKI